MKKWSQIFKFCGAEEDVWIMFLKNLLVVNEIARMYDSNLQVYKKMQTIEMDVEVKWLMMFVFEELKL